MNGIGVGGDLQTRSGAADETLPRPPPGQVGTHFGPGTTTHNAVSLQYFHSKLPKLPKSSQPPWSSTKCTQATCSTCLYVQIVVQIILMGCFVPSVRFVPSVQGIGQIGPKG